MDEFTKDPIVSYNFAFEIQEEVKGFFTEVSGIGSETEFTEHKITVNGVDVIKQIPARLKWEPIVLKRGITNEMDIWEWRKQVEDGQIEAARRNGSITMMDPTGQVVLARWDFVRALPSKVSGPQPKSDSGDIAIEEMTIVHEGIKRVQ